jgi:hypothetical protein
MKAPCNIGDFTIASNEERSFRNTIVPALGQSGGESLASYLPKQQLA